MKIGKVEITAAEIEVYLEYFRVYQKYFYALVVCIVSLQLLFLWVAPELTEYRERTVVLTKFKRILKENEKKLLDKENIERELDRLKALVEEKENIFFNEADFSEFAINILPKLASSFGTQVQSIKYGKPVQKGKHNLFPLDVDLSGDFIGMVNLYNELENFPKIVKITQFSINRQSTNPVRLRVKFRLDAYGLKR